MNEKIVAVKHVGEPENFHCSHLHTTKGDHATMTESAYNELSADYPGLYELVDDEETEAILLEHCETNGCGAVELEAYKAFKAQAENIAVEDEDDEEEEVAVVPTEPPVTPEEETPEEETPEEEAEAEDEEEEAEAEDEEEEAEAEDEEEEAPAPPVRPAPRGRGRK